VQGRTAKMIMPREFERTRMEADRGPLAFDHGTFQVVVHEGPRGSAEDLEGFDMPAKETLEGLVQGEMRKEGARIREDHHKPGQGSRAVADPDRSERAPIDLCLFGWQRHEAAIERHVDLGPEHADPSF
jgi:hypothetical protein